MSYASALLGLRAIAPSSSRSAPPQSKSTVNLSKPSIARASLNSPSSVTAIATASFARR